MKKMLFGLVATIMFSVSSFANNVTKIAIDPVQKASIEYSIGSKKVVVTQNVKSKLEIENFLNTELEKMSVALNSNDVDELTCTALVHVGIPSNYIEVSVTGPCAEIGAAIKKLKKELLALL